MDVTWLTGAARAGDGRGLRARGEGRADGQVFEAVFAEAGRGPDPRRAETRAAGDRAAEQAAERREAERVAERREAERAAERREAERRAAERREAEAASERRDAAKTEDREAEPSDRDPAARDARPEPPAERPAPRSPSPVEADAPEPPSEPLVGALGLAGLVEWLRRGEAPRETAARAREVAPDARPIDEAPFDAEALEAALDPDAPADDAPEAELTRLLEARRPADALARALGERRPADSVRLGPRPADPEAPRLLGPAPLPTTRITEAAARAGATPTALPEGVDESSILRQISDALRLRDGKPGRPQTADIQLHPAELGRVRIRIQMEAGAARVLVSAEHAAVADLLGAGLDQLRRDLVAHGLQIAHLEVRSDLADERGGRRDAPEDEHPDEHEAPAVEPERRARRPRGRIDLEA